MKKEDGVILVVDDDEDILFSLKISLNKRYKTVLTCSDPARIITILNANKIDLILLDMNYKKGLQNGRAGLYWLSEVLSIAPSLSVILMTAYGEIDLAVEGIKKGASDFLLKPCSSEKLIKTVSEGIKRKRNRGSEEVHSPQRKSTSIKDESNPIIGMSPSIKKLKHQIEKFAVTNANILLLGENGTGKYVFAQEIHDKSNRNSGPFVHVDLGTLNENLFEAEMFGSSKGAYTDAKEDKLGRFEMANGGTLFLDEIGNLPIHLQSKLLNAIQHKKIMKIGSSDSISVDVRIVCATNSSLEMMIQEGLFREDLFYRINTIELSIPPLRDREGDVNLLIDYFIDEFSGKYNKGDLAISSDAREYLNVHPWPGNIRELENTMERAVILSDGEKLVKDNFLLAKRGKTIAQNENLNLEQLEKNTIRAALSKHSGNISRAAKDLGITRAALYRRLEKFDL